MASDGHTGQAARAVATLTMVSARPRMVELNVYLLVFNLLVLCLPLGGSNPGPGPGPEP